jgi:hypothetical protein
MPQLDLFHWCTWLISLFSLSVVLVMLMRRKLYPEFPIFTTYVLVQLLGWTAMLWVIPHFPRYVSWYGWLVMQCLDAILSMAVLLEVFSTMLKPYAGIRRLGAIICVIAGVVLVMVAVSMAMVAPPSDVSYARITARVIAWQRSADFARLALLFVLFAFSRVFGLNWRHYVLGIAIGLGIMAVIELLAESIRVEFGFRATGLINVLSPVGYDLGLVIWSYYFIRQESRVAVNEAPQSASLLRWNSALEELLAR